VNPRRTREHVKAVNLSKPMKLRTLLSLFFATAAIASADPVRSQNRDAIEKLAAWRDFSTKEPPFVYLGGKNWKLMVDLTVRMGGHEFTIPAGFVTDFASIPQVFWAVLPPFGEYLLAAVAHDYLYRNGIVPRHVADSIFYGLMVELRVAPWKRQVMYVAVRMFGFRAYIAPHPNRARY
jgi:hypothetical protein